jgi:hypothetical protein
MVGRNAQRRSGIPAPGLGNQSPHSFSRFPMYVLSDARRRRSHGCMMRTCFGYVGRVGRVGHAAYIDATMSYSDLHIAQQKTEFVYHTCSKHLVTVMCCPPSLKIRMWCQTSLPPTFAICTSETRRIGKVPYGAPHLSKEQ